MSPARLSFCLLAASITLLVPTAAGQQGDLDTTFGTGGTVDPRLDGLAADVAVQPDGAILLAGEAFGPGGRNLNFMLTRLLPDGSLDPTFGMGGRVQTDLAGTGVRDTGDAAKHLAILDDGRVVAAGLTGLANPPSPDERPLFAIARYAPDGMLDTTFGTGGTVTLDLAERYGDGLAHRVTDLAAAPEGRLYVAGTVYGNEALGNDSPVAFVVLRLLPDGVLDASFGDAGVVRVEIDAEPPADLLLAPTADGLVAAGRYEDNFALLRFGPGGALDDDFGGPSVLLGDFNFSPVGLARLPDGALLVAGGAATASGEGLGILRFTPDGRLDTSYGAGGRAYAPLTGRTLPTGLVRDAFARDALFGPDGSVLLGGSVETESYDHLLARFRPDGTLDPDFGTGGFVTTDFAGGFDVLVGLATTPEGLVLSADAGFKLARYRTDPPTTTESPAAHRVLSLEPAFPNPFEASTSVRFHLGQPRAVRLVAYDLLGREVAILAEGARAAGTHAVPFDARGLPAGLYVIRLDAKDAQQTQIVLLAR